MKLLKIKDVLAKTGIGSRTSLWRAMREKKFPCPKKIGPNRIAWLESDVDNWASSLPTRNYSASMSGASSGKAFKPIRGRAGQ